MPVHFIDSDAALAAASSKWLERPAVALDTEFMRTRTYFAKAALFQICDGTMCYLIDPVAIANLAPLSRLLEAPQVLKIMHSCSEDLEVCERHLGALPEPLFDTQIAAAFCGHGLSVGYQKLLAQEMNVNLAKSETRTDWLRRPLSESQLLYAADDVAFLPEVRNLLLAKLSPTPKTAWVEEECTAILRRFRSRDPRSEFAGMGGAQRLDSRGLAVLKSLHAWREDIARSKDLPRNWVLPDRCLLQLIELNPVETQQLSSIQELPAGTIRRYGDVLIDLIGQTGAQDSGSWPSALPLPLDARQGRRARALRGLVEERATHLGIAPEMLARRRDCEELIRCIDEGGDIDQLAVMRGWRRAAIGASLLPASRTGGECS